MRTVLLGRTLVTLLVLVILVASSVLADEKTSPAPAAKEAADHQAKLDAALSKMMSGATLEGSFTSNGPGTDSAKLGREKYTLGEVKRVAGDVWQFPARIEYGGKDVTLPIPLPVRWAGDTPVVVVDEVDLPGFGSVSARVMFFDGHYAGYWKHGEHSGNLFGEIHSANDKRPAGSSAPHEDSSSGNNPSAGKKPK
jgi:hypothetical protein